MNLKDFFNKANKEHWAIGHFNVSNLELLKAVVEAAKEGNAPVMVGTSEGEREWLGLKSAVALIKAYKEDWPNIFLNADHTKSAEVAFDAIDAGYDSIHIDGSSLSFKENVDETRRVVRYAKNKSKDISVEGELGYLKGDSQLTNKKIAITPDDYTKPEEALKFVNDTGVDRLAIAIGNIHGINLDEPELDFDLLEGIRKAVPKNVALVLHAGSGISDSDIKKSIGLGISNIHISTELRVMFRDGLEKQLDQNRKEYALYRLEKQVVSDIKELVREKMRLFGSIGKAH